MKINDLFSALLPEEQELSSDAKNRILHTVMDSGKKKRPVRPMRLALIAAALVVVFCISAVAVYKMDWNQSYRERYNVKSEDVPGYVEYPVAEVSHENPLQPVSCVTSIVGLEIRFSYGPISQEEVDALNLFSGKQTHILRAEIKELEDAGCDASIEDYDAESGVALICARIRQHPQLDELTLSVSKKSMATGETEEIVGELVIQPEETESLVAELNLPIEMPDAPDGTLLALRMDAGSYCWVYDIPGIEAWNGDINAIILDEENGPLVFEYTNVAFETYEKGSYVTYRDGTTRPIGGGLGPMWDGEHLCDWYDGGVYDLDNLVSLTINGVEYPLLP